MNRRLFRSRSDTILGGVAGGVAEYLDVDPSLVRIIWAILAIVTGGIFVVLYVVMWIVVPEGDAPAGMAGAVAEGPEGGAAASPGSGGYPAPVVRHHRRGSGNGTLIFGLILIGVGAWFLVRQYLDINVDRLWPVGLVLLGVLLLLVSLRRPQE
jgi:phage shock protein C